MENETIKALDFLGNEIKLGDTVIFMENGYRNFSVGTVGKITEQMVIINHEKHTHKYDRQTRQYHEQVIIKPNKTIE